MKHPAPPEPDGELEPGDHVVDRLGDQADDELAERLAQLEDGLDDSPDDPGIEGELPMAIKIFVYAYIRNRGEPLHVAYRLAYPKKADKPNAWCVYQARKMLEDKKIIAAIREEELAFRRHEGLTVESHSERLRELREEAREQGNIPAAIKAEELRGKTAGLYVDRHEITEKIDPAAAAAELRMMIESDPSLLGRIGLSKEAVKKISCTVVDNAEPASYGEEDAGEGEEENHAERD